VILQNVTPEGLVERPKEKQSSPLIPPDARDSFETPLLHIEQLPATSQSNFLILV